ncbi:unknown protein [Seminavis robusta]|uniref:Uncharacterized protein n=1 Tax=Seminavis robusta TaxID=568900 RepID=A0A9N8EW55_9STRA|nr:unknown protein [Seminavis robusta]|eukprot:Sro2205_g318990.1 n/a (156) ;mRNA; f:16366-16833
MVFRDYAPGSTLWVKTGAHRNQAATFVEGDGPLHCFIELFNKSKVRVNWTSIEYLFDEIEEHGRWTGSPHDGHYRRSNNHNNNNNNNNNNTGPYSNAVPSGVEMNALFYRLVRAEAECSELRGTITSLQDRIQANEDRIQANEEFLHNSDIPSGF